MYPISADERLLRLSFYAFAEHGGFVAGKGDPFIQLTVHLPLQLSHRPTSAQRLGVVKTESNPSDGVEQI